MSFCFRRDIDKLEKVRALREASKRVALGPDNLPSICFYTMLNCAETSVILIYLIFHSIWNSNFSFFPFCESQGHVRRILRGFVTISRRVFRFHPQSLESCTPETPGHETGRAIGRYRQGGRRCSRSYDGRQDGWDYESPSRPLRARLRCLVQSRPDVTPIIVGRCHDPAVEFADVDLPGGL